MESITEKHKSDLASQQKIRANAVSRVLSKMQQLKMTHKTTIDQLNKKCKSNVAAKVCCYIR